jgi:hypothetical protein
VNSFVDGNDPTNGILDFSNSQDYTLNMWVKWMSAENSVQLLYYKGGNSDTDPGYSLQVSATYNFKCTYADSNVGARESVSSTTLANDNKWHYVSCVMDRSGSATGTAGLHVFIDGKLEGSDTTLTELSGVNTRDIQIGETDTSYEYEAYLDDVKIYNYARKPAQVAWDMNQGKPIAHWKLNECTGTVANDSSGNSNTGTISIGATGANTTAGTCSTSGAWFNGASGRFTSSLDFDSTDDAVSVTNASAIDMNEGLANGFTFAAWIYPRSDGENSNGRIFDKGPNLGTIATSVSLRIISELDGYATLGCTVDLTGADTNVTATTLKVPINQWSHVALSWTNDADDESTMWVNGTSYTTGGSSGDMAAESNALFIGGNGTGTNNIRAFDGKIDDFRIYPYELTAARMKTVMNEGSAVRFGP